MRSCIAILLTLCAGPAFAAQQTCTFTEECTVGEGCGETQYEVLIGDEDGVVTLEDVTQTLEADRLPAVEGAPGVLVSRTDTGDSYVMTIARDGDAAYWVRYPSSEIELVYHGTCGKGSAG